MEQSWGPWTVPAATLFLVILQPWFAVTTGYWALPVNPAPVGRPLNGRFGGLNSIPKDAYSRYLDADRTNSWGRIQRSQTLCIVAIDCFCILLDAQQHQTTASEPASLLAKKRSRSHPSFLQVTFASRPLFCIPLLHFSSWTKANLHHQRRRLYDDLKWP